MEYLENQSHRNNIRIQGIAEDVNIIESEAFKFADFANHSPSTNYDLFEFKNAFNGLITFMIYARTMGLFAYHDGHDEIIM